MSRVNAEISSIGDAIFSTSGKTVDSSGKKHRLV